MQTIVQCNCLQSCSARISTCLPALPHSIHACQGWKADADLVIDGVSQRVNIFAPCCWVKIDIRAAWQVHFIQHLHQMAALIADDAFAPLVNQKRSCAPATVAWFSSIVDLPAWQSKSLLEKPDSSFSAWLGAWLPCQGPHPSYPSHRMNL